MSDISTLIHRWQEGNERAAETLYNQHRLSTFQLACGLLGDPDDAEEAAQDALTYALTHIDRYDAGRSSFKTWLHIITVSRCRDRLRRKRLPNLSLRRWLQRRGDLSDQASSPEPHTVRTETRSEVWAAVKSLKPKHREAILLRYWAGHTYHEMADILNCPIGTVQSRVRLAYNQLRNTLAPPHLTNIEEEEVQ